MMCSLSRIVGNMLEKVLPKVSKHSVPYFLLVTTAISIKALESGKIFRSSCRKKTLDHEKSAKNHLSCTGWCESRGTVCSADCSAVVGTSSNLYTIFFTLSLAIISEYCLEKRKNQLKIHDFQKQNKKIFKLRSEVKNIDNGLKRYPTGKKAQNSFAVHGRKR